MLAFKASQVLPFSTGVIGEPLPVAPLVAALPEAVAALKTDNWLAAAKGIMTTDTRPKLRSTQLQLKGKPVTITGIAKGAGMIKPNMATMLAFIFTDAALSSAALTTLLHEVTNASFNRITVDGDTSTNDACLLAATGQSGVMVTADAASHWQQFRRALLTLCQQLAQDLIRDAEGASKFITVTVNGGKTSAECLQVAYAIAESPLVKTACFAADPNWGRILAAVGRAGLAELDINAVELYLNALALVKKGSLHPAYREQQGQDEMAKPELGIRVVLNRGPATETVWTSDLSHDYIRINAEYRT